MDRKYPTIFTKAQAVTKSDTDTSGNVYAGLFIGIGGDVVLVPREGTSANVKFQALPSGTLLAVACRLVLSTGTSATGIVGLN